MDIVEPTAGTDPPPGLAGATLVPWPNRVEGARWNFEGQEQLLAVTEPEFGHANHGLLLDADYDVVSATDTAIELRAIVRDQPGYPFTLDVSVRYMLDETGISVSYRVHNLSGRAAPLALGAHPYLRVGSESVTDLTATIAASRALELDAAHIPRREFDVTGTIWDLRAGVAVGSLVRNAAYGGLALEDSRIVHRLTSSTGHCVELRADPKFAWVQIYVAELFLGDKGRGPAIAIEPMTAPPNALRTGEGMAWLDAGAEWDADWTLHLVSP